MTEEEIKLLVEKAKRRAAFVEASMPALLERLRKEAPHVTAAELMKRK